MAEETDTGGTRRTSKKKRKLVIERKRERGSGGGEEGRGEEAVETRSAMFPLCGFARRRGSKEREEKDTASSSVLSIDEAKVTV